jgi:hypothetical protein
VAGEISHLLSKLLFVVSLNYRGKKGKKIKERIGASERCLGIGEGTKAAVGKGKE